MVGTTLHVRSASERHGTKSADVTTRAVLALPASILLGAIFPPAIPIVHGVWLYKLYQAVGLDNDRAASAAVVIALGTLVGAFLEMFVVINLLFDT
jgi:hypothetical protein